MDLSSWTRRGGVAALLALAVATPAVPTGAQVGSAPDDAPPPGAVELDEVVVRVPRGEIAQAPTAAATVVDASRFAGEAKGVAELLALSPGVDVQRYGTAGQLATVSIRGVASDGVKVLVDGLPLGGAGGDVDLSTIPRTWIRRLEVVRGPVGAAFGAGALGGAVNVVTREASGASVEATAGSFGTYALSAEGGGRAGGFTLLGGATGESTEGDFPYLYDSKPDVEGNALEHRTAANNASRRGGLLLKLSGPLDGCRLDALTQLSGGHRELPGWVYSPTPRNWQDDARVLGMVRLARDLTPEWTVSTRLHARGDLLDTYIAGLGDGTTRQRGGAGGLQVEASRAHAGGGLFTALVSAELEGYSSTALGGGRTRPAFAAAVTGDLPLGGRVKLGPAFRVERTGTSTGFSASLGARIELAEHLRARASAGRTYRVPSFAELYLRQGGLEPNPDLKPARGLGADTALIYDGPLGLLSAGGFVQREDDIITYEPVSLGRFKAQNTNAALMAGAEVEAASAPLRAAWGLALSASYSYLHTEVLRGIESAVGNALPRRPRHQLAARASLSPDPFEAHLEARVVRDQYQDRSNTLPLPDETTLAAGASVQLCRAPRLSLHVQLDNLTDRRDLLDGFGNPLPGRSVMVTLRAGTTDPGAL